jgi:DNA-binding Lrp family transcriptional regulator
MPGRWTGTTCGTLQPKRDVNNDAGGSRVVEAFVLIQTEVGRAEVVAKQVAGIAGVLSSEYVTGPYDVVARVSSDSLADLHSAVVASVQAIDGITRTLTCPVADGSLGAA